MPKISSYPDGKPPLNSDQFIVARSGVNRRIPGMLVPVGWNYKLVPSVASNNLTLALKDLNGDDFSDASPLYVKVADELETISTALSVTKNAATNWANLGSAELATKEVDLFPYLIIETGASAGVKLGWSRIPYGTVVGDFSSTTTNEKYLAGPVNYNATDKVQNIGRFNAILSAGAGYTWSLPATSVIVNTPIFQTRFLDWVPQFTNLSVGDGTLLGTYRITEQAADYAWSLEFGSTTEISGGVQHTLPISRGGDLSGIVSPASLVRMYDGATSYAALSYFVNATTVSLQQQNIATYLRVGGISATIPSTWGASDSIVNQMTTYPVE